MAQRNDVRTMSCLPAGVWASARIASRPDRDPGWGTRPKLDQASIVEEADQPLQRFSNLFRRFAASPLRDPFRPQLSKRDRAGPRMAKTAQQSGCFRIGSRKIVYAGCELEPRLVLQVLSSRRLKRIARHVKRRVCRLWPPTSVLPPLFPRCKGRIPERRGR